MQDKEFEIFQLTKKFKEQWNKNLKLNNLPPLTSWMTNGWCDIPNDLANLFLLLQNKLLISGSIIFRLINFSSSYGFFVHLI